MWNQVSWVSLRVVVLLACGSPVCAAQTGPATGVDAATPLAALIREAIARNLAIEAARFTPSIAAADIQAARGAFDAELQLKPAFGRTSESVMTAAGRVASSTWTSTLDGGAGGLLPYSAVAVAGNLPTGTQYSLSLHSDRQASSTLEGGGQRYPGQFATDLTLSISQPLLRGAGRAIARAPIQAATLGAGASRAGLARAIETTIAEVENAYWTAVYARALERVAEESLARARTLLARNQQLLELQLVANIDVLTARQGVAAREATLTETRQQRADATDVVVFLVYGRAAAAHADTPLDLESMRLPERVEPLVGSDQTLADAMRVRHDLREAELQVDRSRIDVAVARDSLRPSLNLSGSYTAFTNNASTIRPFGASRIGEVASAGWEGGLQLTVPIAARPETAPAAVAVVESFVSHASFAIARSARIKVDDEAAGALSMDAAAARRDGVLWAGLERFCALFEQWMAVHALDVEAGERARLARKAEAEQQMLRRGVVNLAGVLTTAARRSAPAADGTALLAACRAVGAQKGIEFQAPPAWELDRRVRDPLAAICRASRVRQRKVALHGRWWRTSGAALLGFAADSQRPVALLPAGHSRYELYDPAREERVRIDETVAASIEPFAFELYRPSPSAAMGLIDLGRLALAEARGDLPRLLLAAFAGGLLGLVLPMATGNVFSIVIPMAVPANVVPLLATLVAFTLASTCFDLTRAMALIRIEGRTNTALQSTVIDRLLALPVPFFRNYSTGDLTLRAGAINSARNLLSGAALTTVLEGVFSVMNLALLVYYSWQLTLVALAVLVVAVAFTSAFAVATVRVERRRQAAEGVVAGLVFEMIGGIAKLRVAGAERRAFTVWTRRFREQRDLAYRAGIYENCVEVFNEVLPILSTLALLGVAGALVARGRPLPTGDFIAFHAAFGSFFASGVELSGTLINMLNVVPMMERARPILEAPLETSAARPDPGELTGRIEVSHVTFRYKADGPPILRDVSLYASPGEFIAMVGPSGSGKSTLLRLLVGFEAPESGAIYFDEQDLDQVSLSAVRSQMGVVLQSSKLLAGDILQNIVGSAPLTVDEAWDAAEKSGLADDIRRMPMGMYTLVSEGGSTLSGGQRQRLMIARALVRRPRIVLFDEATSALDNRTQQLVSRSLENMKATRIVIAHRLSTVRHADRIYAMESGQIVQKGTYDQLAREEGLFARLIARQLA